MQSNEEKPPEPPNGPLRRVRFGPYEADFHTQEFWKHGIRVRLSGQPFQILEVLLSQPGELITRDELQRRLWPEGTFADFNHSLNAAINKLREALNDSADDPKYIETLPRRGYRFVMSIEPAAPRPNTQKSGALPAVIPPSFAVSGSVVPALPGEGNRLSAPSRKTSFPFFLGLLGVLSLVGIVVIIGAPWRQPQSESENKATELERVAKQSLPGFGAQMNEPVATFVTKRRVALQPRAVLHKPLALVPARMVRTIIPGDSGNAGPQFSPDGRRIAFMSNRSGNWQIWVSAADGSEPVQVSFTESAGTPRWSPDGRSLAFDAPSDEGTSVFVIRAHGHEPAQRLVKGLVPSFSRDGRWIYFASDRSSTWQVWKVSVSGGPQQQVTMHGGFAAMESTDGYVYFSKSRGFNPGMCRIPIATGEEECVLPHLRPRTWSSWAVTRNGILFVEDLPEGRSTLSLYEPAKRQVNDLITLETAPCWIGASADGKKAVMNDTYERQISMVENLQ